ncbi:hypothetical protein Tco_1081833 [Tanacetum coccineum]|uniref:Uncharacterized protein n=1 Tax=Tanacetum coccineum TaxID=301880 RepID=A0ABQ5HYT9_9ASTR
MSTLWQLMRLRYDADLQGTPTDQTTYRRLRDRRAIAYHLTKQSNRPLLVCYFFVCARCIPSASRYTTANTSKRYKRSFTVPEYRPITWALVSKDFGFDSLT